MICPICKSETKEDSKFCTRCGKQIPRCPTCNRVIYQKMRFCINDGSPLPEEIFAVWDSVEVRVEKQKKASSVRWIIPIICILLVIGAAGVFGFYVLSDGGIGDKFAQSADDNAEEDEMTDTTAMIDRSAAEEEETEESTLDVGEQEQTADTAEATETVTSMAASEENSKETEGASQEASVIDPIEYFILNCDKMYFSERDLADFDADMCRIARNGIYAFLGRKFQDEALTRYFSSYDWYMPTIEPEDFSDDLLNEYQIANRDLIVEYEKEKGYR